MLLQEQNYLEMMHMVPSYPPPASSSSAWSSASPASDYSSSSAASSFDFDLDLLDYEVHGLELPFPTEGSGVAGSGAIGDYCGDSPNASPAHSTTSSVCSSQQQVPSPTNALSPIEASDAGIIPHSPTMFSPVDPSAKTQMKAEGACCAANTMPSATVSIGGRYAPLASPVSLPPASPYSPPSCRAQNRLSSTDSARTCSSSNSASSCATAVNLQESLAEFQELQNKIKQERDAVGAAVAGQEPPPPYPGSPKASGSGVATTTTTTKATMQIKIEPVESATFGLPPPPPPAYPAAISRERESTDDDDNVQIKMEPVLSIAFEQIKKDIMAACRMMGISPNPASWTRADVSKWLKWTMQQNRIPATVENQTHVEQWAALGGSGFSQLREDDFKQKFPQEGELMYAQLDIWRSTASSISLQDIGLLPEPASTSAEQQQQPGPSHRPAQKEDSLDLSYVLQMLGDNKEEAPVTTCSAAPQQQQFVPAVTTQAMAMQQQHLFPAVTTAAHLPPPYPSFDQVAASIKQEYVPAAAAPAVAEPMEEEDDGEEEEIESPTVPTVAAMSASGSTPRRTSTASTSSSASTSTASCSAAPHHHHAPGPSGRSSSNIHLWQFVKELLNQPHLYGGIISWVDRPKGIFKINDSNSVATLWGKRKNRPAMNYDKLSRSLRQYYKKGIMKKTERTQRLVYQFCPPYHL